MRERGIRSAQLTGMTDPRGTEEYNLALGERRAQSAQQYLKSLGTDGSLSVSSMGEEMASGSDEAGWARDRRVDIKGK
jgi:peptidoglycan-associated lipoprotein